MLVPITTVKERTSKSVIVLLQSRQYDRNTMARRGVSKPETKHPVSLLCSLSDGGPQRAAVLFWVSLKGIFNPRQKDHQFRF